MKRCIPQTVFWHVDICSVKLRFCRYPLGNVNHLFQLGESGFDCGIHFSLNAGWVIDTRAAASDDPEKLKYSWYLMLMSSRITLATVNNILNSDCWLVLHTYVAAETRLEKETSCSFLSWHVLADDLNPVRVESNSQYQHFFFNEDQFNFFKSRQWLSCCQLLKFLWAV